VGQYGAFHLSYVWHPDVIRMVEQGTTKERLGKGRRSQIREPAPGREGATYVIATRS
jgi:hypothetical protein